MLGLQERKFLKKIGEIIIQELQHETKIIPIKKQIFVKGGELVAKTKGTPNSGWWDFGLYNKNNNNELPKRLSKKIGDAEARTFTFADCPYDYFIEDLKKDYYKKIKKKICGPKELVK